MFHSPFCHGVDLFGVDLHVFLSSQLKCAHLVSTKVPLPEVAIFNQKQAATEKRRTAHKVRHKKRQIAKRDRNDNRTKRRKAGSWASPPMRTRHPRRRGAAMSPARRLTGATCSGRPRRRRPTVLKCHRRVGHKRLGASSCQVTPLAREDQRMVRSHAVPSGTGASEP
jgi:hypothetical protein